MSSPSTNDSAKADAQRFRDVFGAVRDQVARSIVGQTEIVDGVLTALFAGGHVLLEGVPGLGKTMLVRALSEAVDLDFRRIQFTPDMMPADIQGTNVLSEDASGGHSLQFQTGPLVSNLVLADEINRATPKTQSALLEAMQERQISVAGKTIQLQEPFCVMATQNPVEQEGTYPLPEAQLDRFLFKLVVDYPTETEVHEILERTTGSEQPEVQKATDGATILELRKTARDVAVPEHVRNYAVRLVIATQPGSPHAHPSVNEFCSLGSSPRGAQSLILAGKVRALLDGRFAVSTEDIRSIALPVLRHRVLINFRGQSEGVRADDLIQETLRHVSPESVVAG
ncbi:MAG: MoxR family ATPase [Planctomycetota bacterium]